MGRPKEIKCRLDEVTVSNKDFENAIEVFCKGLDVEFKDCIEGFENFLWQVCITIDFNDVSEERWGNGVVMEFEAREDGMHERKVMRAAKFEDKGVVGCIGMLKIGLTAS